jgi:methylthioribose-1-phosphate isomerase
VYVDETRPRQQGARLTVWELLQDNIEPILITDSMAGYLMAQSKVDMVITGADRIALNGDTANKIGTYTLAVLAQAHKVPFYVAAPLSTIDPNIDNGHQIPIEERDPAEITSISGHNVCPPGLKVLNPAFDVTPAKLISGIITEQGILKAPYQDSIRRALTA